MSDELEQRKYPEDERLRRIAEDPDRRMTRDEWEKEESAARQVAHKKHQQVHRDRDQQQEYDRKHRTSHLPWGTIFKWVGIAVVVLLIIFFLGWLPHHDHAKKAAEAARRRENEQPEVDVVQAMRSRTPGELTVPGTTSALTVAYVYARANGYLRQRFVDIGDHVVKGQLLATIEAPDLDAQVAQARQQLRQSEADEAQQQAQLDLRKVTWDRWRVLVARGVFSRQDGDQRETDYKAQLAIVASAHRNVESYRANLDRIVALQEYEKVRAPFTGVSGSPNMSATPSTGESQGGPLFAITQNDKLRILVSVPEGYATSIRRGMSAKVYVQERPGAAIFGTVTRTADSVDTNTRTMLAEVDVDNRNGALYPGMYALVSFVQLTGEPPIVIPGDSVIVRNDRTAVATIHEQKIQMKQVEIGRDYGPEVEILSGLQEGEWLVTSVTDFVQQGVTVRTKPDQKAAGQQRGGGQQTNQVPNSGPNQYGDQSIVNSATESTNQKGGQQKQQGKQSTAGKEQKIQKGNSQ